MLNTLSRWTRGRAGGRRGPECSFIGLESKSKGPTEGERKNNKNEGQIQGRRKLKLMVSSFTEIVVRKEQLLSFVAVYRRRSIALGIC